MSGREYRLYGRWSGMDIKIFKECEFSSFLLSQENPVHPVAVRERGVNCFD